MSKEKTYYIAWNEDRTEGFISNEKSDVLKALGRKPTGMMEATLGAEFRDAYGEDDCHLQTVTL